VENERREQRLDLLEPHWYRNILDFEKRNIPSLLFLDELSTAPENVQGALLQLIFERTIGQSKRLPESTLVIAAANYKQNIPFQFSIMAPIINRFCIVNLRYENTESFLNEFLQEEKEWDADLIRFSQRELTPKVLDNIRLGLKTMLKTLLFSFEKESQDDEGERLYIMDINNQNYAGIYDLDSANVYNFISGRTLSYLFRINQSFYRKGLSMADHGGIMLNMVYGLIGNGTNTFGETEQREYLNSLSTLYSNLFSALEAEESFGEPNLVILDFSGKGAADDIQEWILYHESALIHRSGDPNLPSLTAHIQSLYGTNAQTVEELRGRIKANKMEGYAFANDFQRLDYLIRFLETEPEIKEEAVADESLATLRKIRDRYEELQREVQELIAGFR